MKYEMGLKEYEAIHKETGEHVKVQIEENCCIEHNGQKFCGGGATIYPDFITAYTDYDEKTNLHIVTWSGDLITDRAFYGKTHPWGYRYVHFYFKDSWWTGREIKDGNLVNARKVRSSA